jgi:hypothetical protein
MEAILKFTLPEETDEFNSAVNGHKWKSVVWDIDQNIRQTLKYNETLTEKEYELVQSIRDNIYSFILEQSLELE